MGKQAKKGMTIVPTYGIFPLLSCVAVNCIAYMVIPQFAEGLKHYNLELPIDRLVPLVPASVFIYLICYIFWIYNYILIARQGKEYCYRFATADMLSRLVCGLFYLFLPTIIVRPSITGSGLWETLLSILYGIDSPTRLFPSIHCLVSWFCYIGIRGQKKVPRSYRLFSGFFALLVCVSTQLTKQHYIVDVFGGILLAEVTYRFAFATEIYQYPKIVFEWLYRRCFAERRSSVEKRADCD